MMFGTFPYMPVATDSLSMKTSIRKDQPKLHVEGTNKDVNFLRSLLQRQPRQRCNVKHALGHEYLAKIAPNVAKTGTSRVERISSLGTVYPPMNTLKSQVMPAPVEASSPVLPRDAPESKPEIAPSEFAPALTVEAVAAAALVPLQSPQVAIEDFHEVGATAGCLQTNPLEEDVRHHVSTCDTLPNMLQSFSDSKTSSSSSSISDQESSFGSFDGVGPW
jgi:hypothetical protein